MATCFALFRGVNVGGHNKLPMKDLVAVLEGLGCTDVRTYIQSGNVVFRTERLQDPGFAGEIPRCIEVQFGFAPKVMLLDKAAMDRAVWNNPFDTTVGKALHFSFLESDPDEPDLSTIESLKGETEDYLLKDKVFYLFAPEGIGRSKLAARVESCLGVSATGRNWNTVSRLVSMAEEYNRTGDER